MTFEPTIGDGAQALDVETLLRYVGGNAVLSGLDVSVNSGTFDQGDTISVSSGDVLVDGTEHSVSQTDKQIDSAADNPRKDLVYVDGNGAVQVAKGQEQAALPEDDDTGTRAAREHAYSPSLPDLSGVVGTPIWAIWVHPDNASLEAADVYSDRRPPAKVPTSVIEAIEESDLDFDAVTDSELSSHTDDEDAHHTEDHASRHHDGGDDELPVESLPTGGGSGSVPTAQGDGTLSMESPGGESAAAFGKTDESLAFDGSQTDTISLTDTEVVGNSVGLANRDSTATRPDDGSTFDTSNAGGIQIEPQSELSGVIITVSQNTSGATRALLTDSSGTILDSQTGAFSSGDVVTLNASLSSGTTYIVGFGAEGSEYPCGLNNSPNYPHTSTDVDITSGSTDVLSGDSTPSQARAVSSVQAQGSPLSGEVVVSWPAPTDIQSWNLATLQRTPDGGTVTVDVLDESDTVIISDIGRNEDISSLSTTENIKLRATFSRSDGTENPTLDYIARQYTH